MSRPPALNKAHRMAILIPYAKERFKPLFCFTFLPGSSTVPLANFVMFFNFRFSMATHPYFCAMV